MSPPLQTNLFINGEYIPSSTGDTLSIYSPVDDSLVSDEVQVASEADVDRAVAAARAAFPAWRDTAGHKRAKCMLRFAEILERESGRLAELGKEPFVVPLICLPLYNFFFHFLIRLVCLSPEEEEEEGGGGGGGGLLTPSSRLYRQFLMDLDCSIGPRCCFDADSRDARVACYGPADYSSETHDPRTSGDVAVLCWVRWQRRGRIVPA
jgi:hypothetical protein